MIDKSKYFHKFVKFRSGNFSSSILNQHVNFHKDYLKFLNFVQFYINKKYGINQIPKIYSRHELTEWTIIGRPLQAG